MKVTDDKFIVFLRSDIDEQNKAFYLEDAQHGMVVMTKEQFKERLAEELRLGIEFATEHRKGDDYL